MRLLCVNGPNLNMLGLRDKNIYGNTTYKELVKLIKKHTKEKGIKIKIYQSNSESKLVEKIQKSLNKFDGFILNLAAYTHYSIALRDAVELIKVKKVEVHISNIFEREDFRKKSVIEDIVDKRIIGKGIQGYLDAIDYIRG